MVRKNPAKIPEAIEEKPKEEIPKDIPVPEPKLNKKNICVVKCHLRRIRIADAEDWPENLRGKVWVEGQVKTISKEAYLKLNQYYPAKFELIREE